MPSLRELFEKIPNFGVSRPCNHSHAESYTFLAALLEVVELQECPQGCDTIIRKLRARIRALEALLPRYKSDTATADSMKPEDTDATIRKLRTRLEAISEGGGVVIQGLHRELGTVERELTAALAEIPRLETERDEALHELHVAHGTLVDLCKGLADAKAERDSWERQCRTSEDARGRVLRERNEAKAEIEELEAERKFWKDWWQQTEAKADAEIGELVRGMRPWSRLGRGWAANVFWVDVADPPDEPGDWKRIPGIHNDPAEVLRAIQEVGDAEG